MARNQAIYASSLFAITQTQDEAEWELLMVGLLLVKRSCDGFLVALLGIALPHVALLGLGFYVCDV